MTSQSIKYGGIHDSHFEYIQTTVTSFPYFRVDFEKKTCMKINGLQSTLLQDILIAYITFPFNKKWLNIFTISYVYNRCMQIYGLKDTFDLVILGGGGGVKHAIADKLQKIGT